MVGTDIDVVERILARLLQSFGHRFMLLGCGRYHITGCNEA